MDYRFDRFALDPASRLLRCGETTLDVPRRVFDCLVCLIERRERAVSRDELIEIVWKRSNVSDNQLAHVIATARRLLDDAGSIQRFIRTVPGFGYHWVEPVQASPDPPCEADSAHRDAQARAESASMPAQAAAAFETDSIEATALAAPAASLFSRRAWRAMAAMLVVLLALGGIRWLWQATPGPPPEPARVATAAATWVMPAVLPADSESGASIGLMALVTEELRRQGVDVVSVESVLARSQERGTGEHDPAVLAREMGAATVVIPSARRTGDSWAVTLSVGNQDGDRIQINAKQNELFSAGRLAAQQLSHRLGYKGSPRESPIEEILESIGQLIRTRQFEDALLQLSSMPESARKQPEVGLLQIRLDLERGRYLEARNGSERWLRDLDPAAQPVTVGRFRMTRAMAMQRLGDPGWIPIASEVVDLLKNAGASSDLASALRLRGIAAFATDRATDAATDLLRARKMFLEVGDELGAARITNTMGQMAYRENREADAISLFNDSAGVLEAYGAMSDLIANLSDVASMQVDHAQWADALATTDQLRKLLQTAGGGSDRERNVYLEIRGSALRDSGRLEEALALLDERERAVHQEENENNPDRAATSELVLFTMDRAQLELLRNRWDQASATAAKGMKVALELMRKTGAANREYAEVMLSVLVAAQAGPQPWAVSAPMPVLSSEQLEILRAADSISGILARAYWNARQHRISDAEEDYRKAMAIEMDASGTRGRLRGAHIAYIEFLLARNRVLEASQLLDQLFVRSPRLDERDYGMAQIVLRVRMAQGDERGARTAARQLLALAGERRIPEDLMSVVEGDWEARANVQVDSVSR
ncbi:MAG: winged helix-turn-helix domain-containing protein [Dokdonella sp.]